MPRRYPPEFRRKVLDLLKTGHTVAEVASALDVTEQTIYNWRNQELIDTGQKPGLNSIESAELAAARRSIAESETELAIAKHSTELLKSAAVAEAIRSDRSDTQGRTTGTDLVPESGGVGVRLLRVAQSPTLGTLTATCLVDAADHRGPHHPTQCLRSAACPCGTHSCSRHFRLPRTNRTVDEGCWRERTSGKQTCAFQVSDYDRERSRGPQVHSRRIEQTETHGCHGTPQARRNVVRQPDRLPLVPIWEPAISADDRSMREPLTPSVQRAIPPRAVLVAHPDRSSVTTG